MQTERFFCPCPRGLEPLLVEELSGLGAQAPKTFPGGVAFRGGWDICARVNLESRLATRVLWHVDSGLYRSEDDLYGLAYEQRWEDWFDPRQSMKVHVTAIKSPLKSLNFATLRVKDGVCDRFRNRMGARPSINTTDPSVRVHAFLGERELTLYLDTSGTPLYKRGYKFAKVEAPLKENLAAGILRIAGWTPDQPLFDPMCGSGTFLLEAAQIALDRAPGLGRRFALETSGPCPAKVWKAAREAAEARAQPARPLQIFGADIDADQLVRAEQNLAAAGLSEAVKLRCEDVLLGSPPAASGVMVANPPYGVRLGEAEQLLGFYRALGDALKKRYTGWRCLFLSSDTAFPKNMGLRTSRRVPLWNGALECRIYEYAIVAGKLDAQTGA
ncbi:MAG: class I SAM-dependent RNA methyltransferase [Rhodocyclaceae bacterium]|nr:class I SAM-dependent RNA methyltransferase [Rhodocyclaceae bacterium]MBX3668800.1 class I SAM-dependent RNA methyltransferase [Rhodocyclaceae bacterium]